MNFTELAQGAQSFTSKAKGLDTCEILKAAQLGGVVFQSEAFVVFRSDTRSIVDDLDGVCSVLLEADLFRVKDVSGIERTIISAVHSNSAPSYFETAPTYRSSACVQRILHQLLDCTLNVENDLTACDSMDVILGDQLDALRQL